MLNVNVDVGDMEVLQPQGGLFSGESYLSISEGGGENRDIPTRVNFVGAAVPCQERGLLCGQPVAEGLMSLALMTVF